MLRSLRNVQGWPSVTSSVSSAARLGHRRPACCRGWPLHSKRHQSISSVPISVDGRTAATLAIRRGLTL